MMPNKADINWIVSYLEGSVFDGQMLKKNWDGLIDENEKLKKALQVKMFSEEATAKAIELNRDLVGLLKEIKERLEICFDDDLYEKTIIVLEKAEGVEQNGSMVL